MLMQSTHIQDAFYSVKLTSSSNDKCQGEVIFSAKVKDLTMIVLFFLLPAGLF